MTIHESIEKEIPQALRAGDEVRLRTLRSLFAALTNEEIARRARSPKVPMTLADTVAVKNERFLDDEDTLKVIRRAANQRRDSIEQYEKGGRPDLAEPEKAELVIIESYLPAQMTREQIETRAKALQSERGFSIKADAGMFIGALMKEFKGTADGADVKAVVDSLLA